MVYEAATPDVPNPDRRRGVYLRSRAAVRHLQKFLDPLYASHGIGISTCEDEILHDPQALAALSAALQHALSETQHQPEIWTEIVGYTFKPFQPEPGEPIEEVAYRDSFVEFLRGALAMCQLAATNRSYLVWGGGE